MMHILDPESKKKIRICNRLALAIKYTISPDLFLVHEIQSSHFENETIFEISVVIKNVKIDARL